MEYALWDQEGILQRGRSYKGVLILVVMEYALWDEKKQKNDKADCVLILVVMEYALWDNLTK